jgi:hypothetical protein
VKQKRWRIGCFRTGAVAVEMFTAVLIPRLIASTLALTEIGHCFWRSEVGVFRCGSTPCSRSALRWFL